jgi:hypothetical protein
MDESTSNEGQMWIVPGDDFDAGQAADKLHIGDYATRTSRLTVQGDGNVGIGTTNPGAKLEVAGLINAGLKSYSTYTGNNSDMGIRFYSRGANTSNPNLVHPAGRIYGASGSWTAGWDNQALVFGAADGWSSFKDSMRIKGNGDIVMTPGGGKVLIGSNIPDNGGNIALGVGGNLWVNGSATKTSGGTVWYDASDRRIKTRIEEMRGDNALNAINQLRPVKFRYKKEYLLKHPMIKDVDHYSFIAQELREVWPDSVLEGPDGFLLIDVSNTTPFLVSAVQELAKEVKELKKEVDALKGENVALKKK